MEVTANITRNDLVRFQFIMLVLNPMALVLAFNVALVMFIVVWILELLGPQYDLEKVMMACLATGAITFILLGFMTILCIYLTRDMEVIGKHLFTISPEGLSEKADRSQTFSQWRVFKGVRRMGGYIFMHLGGCMYHIIPRRSFDSDAAYTEFWETARDYWKDASPKFGSKTPPADD